MMEQRVTLRKIAELCGLAPTTVSSILHGRKTYCSQAKIELVRKTVRELGYAPSVGYNIMTGRETNIVAIVYSQKRVTQHEMLRNLYMNLCVGLNERNYAMYTAVLNGDSDEQMRMLRSLEERGCRAFLFIGTPMHHDQIAAHIAERKYRLIGFNNQMAECGVIADQAGAYVRYLDILERSGRRNIRLALTRDFTEQQVLPRLAKCRRRLYSDACMDVPHVRYIKGSSATHYYQLGHDQMKAEILRNPGLEAILFPTDYHVMGAADALAELGRSPDTVELFGMDDSASVCFTRIRMTTTRFDMESAAMRLMELLDNPVSGIQRLPGEIIHYPAKPHFLPHEP